jgi:hypothetical protein
MHVCMPIPNLRQKPDAFPEPEAARSRIDGHDTGGSKCPFEQGMGNVAPDTGPTESQADIGAPHPERIGAKGRS